MSETATWQPSAPIPNLLKRAAVMAEIRRFFTDRGVLEVETPCMSQATVTDIHLFPFETRFVGPGHSQGLNLYLMTSPEYHMKRLLAAGCGPVFQLCRSFRNEEMGRHHNPEFTMLEWYRPCYDMYRLINEVDDLLQQVLECQPAESLSYQQAFQRHLEIDPLSADKAQLREVAAKLDLSNIADTEEDRDTLLQLLFTMGVEPHIGKDRPTFIYHFPATQASLAQISPEDHRVAERFEVYYKGIELANGFHELTDAHEQRLRFEQDNRKRAARGLPQQPIDNNLLAALEAYFLENKVFYCNALAYNGQNSLQQYMFDYLRSIFEQNARELNPDANAEETRKIGQFFAGAMMGILIPWVLSGMKSNALSNVSELSIPVFNHEIMQKLLRGDPQ